MSESPKMGLFGSKDETKETKKESKGGSPDRYAPYCIDSDSETYDTEALSIMDINDIIGVQSEPVSDSTLESEIAALSQMITESKTDGNQSATQKKSETPEVHTNSSKAVPVGETGSMVQTTVLSESLEPTVKELGKVSCAEETCDNMKQLIEDHSQFNNENILKENIKTTEQGKNNDTQKSCKVDALVECTSDFSLQTSGIIKNKEDLSKCTGSQQGSSNVEILGMNNEVTIIQKENSIRGSLQLIGEAYSSEDSQESTIASEELKQTNLITSFNEDSLNLCNKEDDIQKYCESERDVDNISANNKNIKSNESCIEQNLVDEIVKEKEAYSTKADLPQCSAGSKSIKEFPVTFEDVPNEYQTDSQNNMFSDCDQEGMKIDVNGIMNAQNKDVDTKTTEETSIRVQHEVQVDEKEDFVADTCVEQDKKCETPITETGTKITKDSKIMEDMDIDEENSYKSEEFVKKAEEAKERSTEIVNVIVIENSVINNDDILNMNITAKINKDVEVTQKENKLGMQSAYSGNKDNLNIDAQQMDNLSHETGSAAMLEATSNILKLTQKRKEMEVDKLEVTETELEQNFEILDSAVNNQFSIDSKQKCIEEQENDTEFTSKDIKILSNAANKIDNAEANMEIESEEKCNLVSTSSEVIANKLENDVVLETIDTCSTQQKTSMEVYANVQSESSIIEKNTNLNITNSISISTTEDCLEDKVQQLFKECDSNIMQEMKTTEIKATEIRDCTSECQSEISNIVVDTRINRDKTDKTPDTTQSLEDSFESKDVNDFIHHEEVKSEIHIEKKMAAENQIEDKDTGVQLKEEKIKAQKQAENEALFELQVEENATMEVQMKDKIAVEKLPEERIMVADRKEDKALIEEHIMEERIISAEKKFEQNINIEEGKLEQNINIEEGKFEQNINIEEEKLEQNINIEEGKLEQNINVEEKKLEQNVYTEEGKCEQNINKEEGKFEQKVIIADVTEEGMHDQTDIIEQENLEQKDIFEEDKVEQVIIEEEKCEQIVFIENEKLEQKVFVQAEKFVQKPIIEKEKLKQKCTIEDAEIEQMVFVDEEMVKQKAILDEEMVDQKTIVGEEILEEKSTIDEEIIEQKNIPNEEILKQKAIVEEEILKQKNIDGEILKQKVFVDDEVLEQKVIVNEKILEENAIADTEAFEQNAITDAEVFEQNVITDEEVFEHNAIADEEMFEQNAIADEEVFEQNAIADEELLEQNAIADEEVFEQNAAAVNEVLEQKVVDEEMLEQKVVVDEEMLEEKIIVDEKILEHKIIVDEEMHQQKIIINEEILGQKDIIDEEVLQEKVIIDGEMLEQNVVVGEEVLAQKVIDEEMLEEQVIDNEEMLEQKTVVDQRVLQQNVIIGEELYSQNVIANEMDDKKVTSEEETVDKLISEEKTVDREVIAEEKTVDSEVIAEEETVDKEVIAEEEIIDKEVIAEEEIVDKEVIAEKEVVDKEVIAEEEMGDEEAIMEEETNGVVSFIKQVAEESAALDEVVDNEKEEFHKDVSKQEQIVARKNSCVAVEKNIPEQLKTVVLEAEENLKIESTTNYTNEEDVSSDSKLSKKDLFLSSEQIIVAAEDAKEEQEEYIEDEMNLTLEPEEIELQVETTESNIDNKAADKNDTRSHEAIIKVDQESCDSKADDDTLDLLNMKKSNNMEIEVENIVHSDDAADIELSNKNEGLLKKQQLDDNDSKKHSTKDNLKDILESVNNVEDIFSAEQCQNTQDIVTSILDDVRSATDFKNILSTEGGIANEIEDVLQQSENLPLAESEIDELTEKLPRDSEDILGKDMDDSISNQNMDSLEGLLGLDLMQEGEDSALKESKREDPLKKSEQLSKVVDMSLLLRQSNNTDITQASDYISHVINTCLTDRNNAPLKDAEISDTTEAELDKIKDAQSSDILKDEAIISESINKGEYNKDLQDDLKVSHNLSENEVDIEFEEAPLDPVDDFEETETELELASNILLQNVDQAENLSDTPAGLETSQPSFEISELESAVKFLQESEEQGMDSPLVLSPKMVESVVEDISKEANTSLFVPDEDICENTSELEEELQNIGTDSISISEAEIISEAAKLESERKLAEQIKINISKNKFQVGDGDSEKNETIIEKHMLATEISNSTFDAKNLQNMEMQQTATLEREKLSETIATLSQKVLKTSESIPKISILEERLKEPPKIEIPYTDVTKVSMSPTTSKDSLLIQKDAKLIAYQKMLESPKLSDKSEPKISETPRKDSEKHDFENVGSPRIILKIAKSAITDCGEPRSPKSPKIRSATNSPNPEDSPGQKLGKIKLKLSKGGHPSIISNENIEEIGQWYSEGSSSLSPIGMKIKLSKSGDASIVLSEKYDTAEDAKESKHKYEEVKRTESPIGMKIKLSKSGDASIVQQDNKEVQIKHKDKLDMIQGSPKRTESPIGMKIKLSKTGDASIIQPERQDLQEEHKDNAHMKSKDRHESCYDSPKRTDSPIGMKIKLSKSGDASIVSPDLLEESKESGKVKESSSDIPKGTESPIGMKIKLTKTKGGASIISVENPEEIKDKLEIADIPKRTESPLGMKIKLSKTGDASIVHSEVTDEIKEKADTMQDTIKLSETMCGMKIKVIRSAEMQTVSQESFEESIENQPDPVSKVESPLGMKIKFSKFGDASIVPPERQEQSEESKSLSETPKRTESPLGMKIKLSKTGDASIIQAETSEDAHKIMQTPEAEHTKIADATLGMKIKLLKTGDASIVDSDKKDRQQRRRDTESPLEMKIKLSKTGHPTIVACDNQVESGFKQKDGADVAQNFGQRYKDSGQACHKEPALKILKTGQSTILQSNRSELTIEPVQTQGKKPDNVMDISPKRKDITISPIEAKKSKLETQLTQILPEVTIQPVTNREQKQFLFDPKSNSISLQQMNVINQEISITQVRPQKAVDALMSEKLKDILSKNATGSPMNSDCEIIEHRPELIIVNENSNSSQDVMIIEEVSTNRIPEVKVPKKRGRPRRNPLPPGIAHPPPHMLMSKDSLPLDEAQLMQRPQVPHFAESRENERPKRTCRSQKSYAPPKRGRGRGRGKRKMDTVDPQLVKKPRIDQDLSAIEASTTAVITIDDPTMQHESFGKSPELYKALKQPAMDSRVANSAESTGAQLEINKIPEMRLPKPLSIDSKDSMKDRKLVEISPERMQRVTLKDDRIMDSSKSENKDMLVPPGHPHWLTPVSKRANEGPTKHENVFTVQVIDEETRMSAESGSRSQTPARNISAPASETIVNEESQGSVLSTATTESEKVKVKNRRMEINFDPDEGPFTVDKIAEYEWPLDRKGETFMIQEQISQYLGVKSFKRKYPDLKRRVVDMEERNYLRENGLVSEAMCDMGLTAVCSSEVLDVMCSDFPDQYEEYRKHMREKQVKEHSKKQKELTAAANAEKNRIDLAEMAVQSALSWNISLNKARRENRKCSLDLQTFTIHVPKKQQKVEVERRIGHYPVALIPGQYTDYYREYTPAELRYYPLNTVLYGPMRPNERKFDSQSEGSQSDSDSDSSSDDSSSSSSEGTQDTEGSQSTMDDVDMEIANQKDEIKLKCKMCLKTLNKHSKNEVLIQCGTCNGHVHPSCIDLTLDMVPHIQSYAWQCTDCKTCAQCHDPADEDKMLFCDMCDRGYHIYCVGLRRVPQGRWHCQECAVCANCGSREPGGMNSDRNSVAQWQHEYKKGDKNTRVYVSTLCVPCSKLWRKGRYCPHCSRCHTAPRLDLEANLVHCSACDKYLHLGCVETKGVLLDRKNYLCDFCAPNRQHVVKPLVSKTLKT